MITFDANGGLCTVTRKNVTFDSAYGTLPTPTRTGYTFNGWYTAASGGTQVTSSTIVSNASSHTLYAHWTAHTYSVHYDRNGATSGSMENSTHTYGKAQNLTANGYSRSHTVTYELNGGKINNSTNDVSVSLSSTFNNWNRAQNGSGTSYSNSASVINLSSIQNDVVNLYAQWTLGTTNLIQPSKTGYSFEGWYSNSGLTTRVGNAGASYTPTSNTTLYANYTPITYSVHYDGNGATSGSMVNSTHTYDTAKNLTANGYSRSHTLTYVLNGGKINNSTSDVNDSISSTFNNWNRAQNGSGTSYSNSASVINLSTTQNDVINLYAQWNLGTTNLREPSKYGYNFEGWYSNSGLTAKVGNAGNSYTPTNNTTLYANWVAKNDITVTFNANGGTCSTASKTVTFDAAYGTLPDATRTNYMFNGWYTAASGGTQVTDATIVSNASNHTLYAHWIKIPELHGYERSYDSGNTNWMSFVIDAKGLSVSSYKLKIQATDGNLDSPTLVGSVIQATFNATSTYQTLTTLSNLPEYTVYKCYVEVNYGSGTIKSNEIYWSTGCPGNITCSGSCASEYYLNVPCIDGTRGTGYSTSCEEGVTHLNSSGCKAKCSVCNQNVRVVFASNYTSGGGGYTGYYNPHWSSKCSHNSNAPHAPGD